MVLPQQFWNADPSQQRQQPPQVQKFKYIFKIALDEVRNADLQRRPRVRQPGEVAATGA